jgi:hypothetical protein
LKDRKARFREEEQYRKRLGESRRVSEVKRKRGREKERLILLSQSP